MRGFPKLIGIVVAVGVLVLVLACGLLALVPRGDRVLTQQEAEQQATQFAQNEYAGTVTSVSVQQVARGEIGAAFCDPVQKVLVPLYTVVRISDWNHCDPNIRMWDIKMQGDFTWHDGGKRAR